MIHLLKADKIQLQTADESVWISTIQTGQVLRLTSDEWRELAYLIEIMRAAALEPS
jgi:frataxin-like iron-binding protein CyaY